MTFWRLWGEVALLVPRLPEPGLYHRACPGSLFSSLCIEGWYTFFSVMVSQVSQTSWCISLTKKHVVIYLPDWDDQEKGEPRKNSSPWELLNQVFSQPSVWITDDNSKNRGMQKLTVVPHGKNERKKITSRSERPESSWLGWKCRFWAWLCRQS